MATFRFMKHDFRTDTVLQAVLDFSFVIVGIFIGVEWVGSGLKLDFVDIGIYAVILATTMAAVMAWLGMYERVHSRTVIDSQARAVLALHLSVPLAYLIFMVLPIAEPNRLLLQISGMAAIFGMLVSRIRIAHTGGAAFVVHRILIFGAGAEAQEVANSINEADPTVQIVGFFPGSKSEEIEVPPGQVLSTEFTVAETVARLQVDEVVVAVGERRGGRLPLRELLDCRVSGIHVMDRAAYFERMLGQIRLDSLKAGWLIFGDGFTQGGIRTAIKRAFDIVAATALLLLFSPVMLIVAILILLDDGFPLLYRQERVGLHGRLFKVIKFRSMRVDAEADGKPRWATSNDDRTTRVGRLFRKLRIDELPQLFSVLKGDMSLVGPRPERAYFVDQLTKLIPFYALRHSIKPGVTGWAQVRYQYGASVGDAAQKLQYDLYYVKNHSLMLDMVVLFETVGVVVSGKGAQ